LGKRELEAANTQAIMAGRRSVTPEYLKGVCESLEYPVFPVRACDEDGWVRCQAHLRSDNYRPVFIDLPVTIYENLKTVEKPGEVWGVADRLRNVLRPIAPGRVSATKALGRHIAALWEGIDGCDEDGSKLLGRMEQVRWQPPMLFFVIERYSMVNASVRAERQHWTVNIDKMTAEIVKVYHRKPKPKGEESDVEAITSKIVRNILAGEEDLRLLWITPEIIEVDLKATIPEGPGYRLTRRRVRTALKEVLKSHRWMAAGRNGFCKMTW
jgi:hypothetical protein